MATSYTPNKAIGEPALGDTGWGTTVNTSISQIDTAFGGSTGLNVTALSGNQTLSSAQYAPLTLNVSGVLTANVNYVVPSGVGGQWMVYNGATGAFVLSISSAAGGSAVTVPPGALINVSCDGTASGMRTTQSVSSVAFSTSLSGLTVSGSPITSSGTIALSGILGTTSGGTGLTSFTSGGAIYASGTTTLTSGTLPVASGGTGVTTSTGTGNVVLSSGPTITLGNATGLPLATGVTGTLPIANGGTGLTTTPSNGQIDIGNGTGFTRATLTAGSGITITNGAGSVTVTSAGVSSQAFTSTGTFTIPTGVTSVKVTIIGAGGGGSTATSCCSFPVGPSGGAGGAAITYLTSLTPGNTIAVTVGTGGATGTVGSTGGSSSIASGTQTITTVTVSGGSGGNFTVNPTPGGSVTAGSPTISITGASSFDNPSSPNNYNLISPLFGGISNGSGGRGSIYGGTPAAGRSGLVLFEW